MFLILGTPRSGTSCVGGILHRLGIHMGDRSIPANPMNPLGFYQDVDFDALFHDTMPDGMYIPETDFKLPEDKIIRLKELIEERCKHRIDWGVKCSRMSFIFDDFRRFCTNEIKLIITQRDPELSIASMSNWLNENHQSARQMITRAVKMLDKVASTTDLPVLTINYPNLIEYPAENVATIADYCGKEVNQEAIDFVKKELARFTAERGIRGHSEHDEAKEVAQRIMIRTDREALIERLALKIIREHGTNADELLVHLLNDEHIDWMTRRQQWLSKARSGLIEMNK